jgi:hypothetical protein
MTIFRTRKIGSPSSAAVENERAPGARSVWRTGQSGPPLNSMSISRMNSIAKIVSLPFLAAIAFLGNAYGSLYFVGYFFPRILPRPYMEMLSAAAVGASVAGALVSLPLVRLYPSRYWLAALVVASPLMAIRVSDIAYYTGKQEPRITVMSIAELFIYPGLMLVICWLTSRFYPRLKHAA